MCPFSKSRCAYMNLYSTCAGLPMRRNACKFFEILQITFGNEIMTLNWTEPDVLLALLRGFTLLSFFLIL